MFKTYIKLAFRSLIKNKVFSFINIFGLSIGLTSFLLISIYVIREFSYDSYQELRPRLFQVGAISNRDGKEYVSAHIPAPMAPALQQEFPEIESTTRLIDAFQDDKTLIQYQTGKDIRSFYEIKGFFADSTFFRLFTYKFKEGNPATALNDPNSVVLTDEIARKLFGTEPALNKVIHINSNTNGEFDFKITGVFQPIATPSHIDARFIMSIKGGGLGQWVNNMGNNLLDNNMFFTYLLLKPGADPNHLENKLKDFVEKHAGAELKSSGRSVKHFLTPVRDIHLHATEGNVSAGGNVGYLFILISIAIIILLIACVNFMNLSTARSSKRAIEIGVRKVLGAKKNALVKQFLWEAILLSFLSFLISLGFAVLLLPLFEKATGNEFQFNGLQFFYLPIGLLFISVLAGLLAGMYPAFYLSAFKPVKVLKGKFTNSLGAVSFRKVLVVFQFVIAVTLIVASITISNQMHYLRTKDLGFEKDEQIVIPLRTSTSKEIYLSLKNALSTSSFISSAGGSLYYPGVKNVTDWLLYKKGTSSNQTRDVFMNWIDTSYLQTLGVHLVAGRLFSKEFPGDTANRIVLNEQAARDFGFTSPEEAPGKQIAAMRGTREDIYTIVGIVKDFNFEGLHSQIKPYGFLLNSANDYNYLVAHTDRGSIQSALQGIAASWSRLNPNEPFEYSFLDEDFQKNYVSEERMAAIIRYFTIIAIFISCLGLFGLTTFSVEQRIKEIGIRKVLGASTIGIVSLLSKDFLKLVSISFLMASPLAWYFIHKWLEDFAYKAPFTIWIVIAGWFLALLIAFLTISIQAVKVALTNPVQNLRTE
jgi:putative ABC transport system permease protein